MRIYIRKYINFKTYEKNDTRIIFFLNDIPFIIIRVHF